MKRSTAVVVVVSSMLMMMGCIRPRYVRSEVGPNLLAQTAGGLSEHVVVISIDGLRPDAIGMFGATTLNRLIGEGSYTLSATTILPSKTLPAHTSMLTGQPPSMHGVSWNTDIGLPRHMSTPTIFGVLRSNGYVTAAFFSKSKFSSLQRAGTLDYSQAPGLFSQWPAEKTVGDVERYLANNRPNLLFIHLGDTDHAGHRYGWMSPKYGEAVQFVDSAVGRILTAADKNFGAGNFTLIVTADHGGHSRNHGSDDPRDVTIPWIVWGRAVKPGPLSQSVKTTDTAATVLWLFRVKADETAGRAVVEAF